MFAMHVGGGAQEGEGVTSRCRGGGKAGTRRAAGYKLAGAASGAEKLPSPAESPSRAGGLQPRPFPGSAGLSPAGGQEEGPRGDQGAQSRGRPGGRGRRSHERRGHVGAQRVLGVAGQRLGRPGPRAAACGRLARAAVLRRVDAARPGRELSCHLRHLPPQADADGDQLLHR